MGRVVIKGGKESDIEVFVFVLQISIGQLDRWQESPEGEPAGSEEVHYHAVLVPHEAGSMGN